MNKTTLLIITLFSIISLSAQTWVQKASYPGQGRVNPESFSIGDKGYIGIGSRIDVPSAQKYNDLWEYNTSNNVWTQKASVPGTGRTGGIGVSDSTFGYIGLGWDGNSYFKDIRRFDPINNSWFSETTYPGQGSRNCFAVENSNVIYIGGGSNANGVVSDFWQYNLDSSTWHQISTFVLGNRQAGISFTIDSLIFFGMGHNGNNNFKDLWAYNINSGLWTQFNNFPGSSRIQASVNVIGKKAIIGGGHLFGVGGSLSDYYEFDYLNNNWRPIVGFSYGSRTASAAFTIGNRAFLSSGRDSLGISLNDLWEYTGLLTDIKINETQNDISIFPNPTSSVLNLKMESNSMVSIFDSNGSIVYKSNEFKNESSIDVSEFDNGLYYLMVLNNDRVIFSKSFIKIK